MSFYNTQNPTKYVTQNPAIIAAQKTDFLLNGFLQKGKFDSIINVDVEDAYTYTAQQVINGYNVRASTGSVYTDITPTAVEIIEALNANQSVRATNQFAPTANAFMGTPVPREVTVQPGFYFDWHILNGNPTGGQGIEIEAGTGVELTYDGAYSIEATKLGIIRVIVTNITPGSEQVYMVVMERYT
jgi:hypothetical protein